MSARRCSSSANPAAAIFQLWMSTLCSSGPISAGAEGRPPNAGACSPGSVMALCFR